MPCFRSVWESTLHYEYYQHCEVSLFTPMKKVSYLEAVHVQGRFLKWTQNRGHVMVSSWEKNDTHTRGRLSVPLGSILTECL